MLSRCMQPSLSLFLSLSQSLTYSNSCNISFAYATNTDMHMQRRKSDLLNISQFFFLHFLNLETSSCTTVVTLWTSLCVSFYVVLRRQTPYTRQRKRCPKENNMKAKEMFQTEKIFRVFTF